MLLEPMVDVLTVLNPKVGEYYPGATIVARYTLYTYADVPANTLHADPYPVFRRMRFDRIGLYVAGAGAAGARMRLGIYKDTGQVYPGELVVDAGEVAADTVGNKELTIDATLEPGLYWLAHNANDPTIDVPLSLRWIPVAGMRFADTRWLRGCYYISQTYGALPPTYPTGAADHDLMLRIMLRVAEVF